MASCFTGAAIPNRRLFPFCIALQMARASAPVLLWACLCLGLLSAVSGQEKQNSDPHVLPSVTISAKANRDPVEKSYRKMIRGMDLFEKEHQLSPSASLRFKLLPRRRETDMDSIEIDVIGATMDFSVPVAPDHSFSLPRNAQAYEQDAQVTPNRKAQSMTWRSDIRTPGLPPNTRRLGDLRLECRVGMEAGLVSSGSSLIGRISAAVFNTPAYCDRPAPLYLFFADQPLFSVAMVAGARKEILAIDKLYAAASDDPRLKEDLPFCDCEVLVDRTYVLPLGDRSWPDDTLVEFEFMDDAAAAEPATPTDALAAPGPPVVVKFDNGYEVRVFRQKATESKADRAEFVLLVAPSGIVKKTRIRPAYALQPGLVPRP